MLHALENLATLSAIIGSPILVVWGMFTRYEKE